MTQIRLLRVVPEWDLSLAAPLARLHPTLSGTGSNAAPEPPGPRSSPGEKICLQRRKVPLYGRNGIPEVWLVDLTRDVLEVHRDPTRDGYRSVQRLRRGERIAPQAFPDFEIAVETILP